MIGRRTPGVVTIDSYRDPWPLLFTHEVTVTYHAESDWPLFEITALEYPDRKLRKRGVHRKASFFAKRRRKQSMLDRWTWSADIRPQSIEQRGRMQYDQEALRADRRRDRHAARQELRQYDPYTNPTTQEILQEIEAAQDWYDDEDMHYEDRCDYCRSRWHDTNNCPSLDDDYDYDLMDYHGDCCSDCGRTYAFCRCDEYYHDSGYEDMQRATQFFDEAQRLRDEAWAHWERDQRWERINWSIDLDRCHPDHPPYDPSVNLV